MGQQRQMNEDFETKWQMLITKQALPASMGVYAVKTTGIFCRFGCPSRVPLKENINFFDSAALAAKSGFRACKRCKPCHNLSQTDVQLRP